MPKPTKADVTEVVTIAIASPMIAAHLAGRAVGHLVISAIDSHIEQDKPCPKCYTRRYHHLERIGEKVMCDYCARRYSPPEFEDKK